MRLSSPGATSSWIAAASSLACSNPSPAPRVQVVTPILTSRTTTSSAPQSPDTGYGSHARTDTNARHVNDTELTQKGGGLSTEGDGANNQSLKSSPLTPILKDARV